ncbi:MAG: response regulator, partial [Acidobacteriota bacterium]|nr:response regulator [Acidobacteriota bacterium]
FRIYLPALEGAVPETVRSVPPAALHGTETILLVEDDAAIREYTSAALDGYGYHVISAANAGEALLIFEREGDRIDLILTDVVMPYTSGRELADRLEKLRPGIRVLFMSGYTDDMIVHHGVVHEGVNFIQKPFVPADLARKVRSVLDA